MDSKTQVVQTPAQVQPQTAAQVAQYWECQIVNQAYIALKDANIVTNAEDVFEVVEEVTEGE